MTGPSADPGAGRGADPGADRATGGYAAARRRLLTGAAPAGPARHTALARTLEEALR